MVRSADDDPIAARRGARQIIVPRIDFPSCLSD
jgi:hypothetical protein